MNWDSRETGLGMDYLVPLPFRRYESLLLFRASFLFPFLLSTTAPERPLVLAASALSLFLSLCVYVVFILQRQAKAINVFSLCFFACN